VTLEHANRPQGDVAVNLRLVRRLLPSLGSSGKSRDQPRPASTASDVEPFLSGSEYRAAIEGGV
jgi:hypothetical protein